MHEGFEAICKTLSSALTAPSLSLLTSLWLVAETERPLGETILAGQAWAKAVFFNLRAVAPLGIVCNLNGFT